MVNLSRHLALTPFAIALFMQPAFAHAHFAVSHRGYYRHVHLRKTAALRHRRDIASRRRVARTHWRRTDYAFVPENLAAPLGSQYSQYANGYSAPMRSWQPRAAAVRPGFANQPFPADAARASAWSYSGWNSERAAQWRSAEHSQFQDTQFQGTQVQEMAEQAASSNGVPLSLVDRVIKRESGGNPRAISRGNYGLMQIRLGTARTMGYEGSAAGLLDPVTNMTYAVRYLAGAYRAGGGSENRAVALYARGYRAAPRVENASFYGAQPAGETMWQSAGFSDWSGGYYAPAYRRRPRRRFVF